MRECVIIGGGVAGLSAAIRLAELGHPPLLIDAGHYPGHRLCGEFFSPECLPLLKRWGIALDSTIVAARFIFNDKEVDFAFPKAAGGLSRYHLDMHLLKRAQALGAEIRTETQVAEIIRPTIEDGIYQVRLSDGTSVESKQLMIGTGRLPQLSFGRAQPPVYSGFKAHFEGLDSDPIIEMHCFKGGYAGISQIAPKTFNVACLVRLDQVADPATFIDSLAQQQGLARFQERYQGLRMLFPQWITAKVPEFGLKQNPSWPNVYWIGDAAGTIPPVCGDGLGIALTTGVMAADYLVHSNAEAFRRDWRKRYRARFFWGKLLHHIVLRPSLSKLGVVCFRVLPSLPQKLFTWTREGMDGMD